jgi:hypothetical protein
MEKKKTEKHEREEKGTNEAVHVALFACKFECICLLYRLGQRSKAELMNGMEIQSAMGLRLSRREKISDPKTTIYFTIDKFVCCEVLLIGTIVFGTMN